MAVKRSRRRHSCQKTSLGQMWQSNKCNSRSHSSSKSSSRQQCQQARAASGVPAGAGSSRLGEPVPRTPMTDTRTACRYVLPALVLRFRRCSVVPQVNLAGHQQPTVACPAILPPQLLGSFRTLCTKQTLQSTHLPAFPYAACTQAGPSPGTTRPQRQRKKSKLLQEYVDDEGAEHAAG